MKLLKRLDPTITAIAIILMCFAGTIFLSGCMGVPKTKVSFNPATGEVAIASPKNIALESAEFTKTTVTKGVTNTITAKVKGYSSTNSVEALKAIAEANANSMAALAKAGQDTLATAIKAAK